MRSSLPQRWAYDSERRQQARGPAARPFQTTPAIALQRLDQARAWGVPHQCVVAEADDGDSPNLLAGLEARPEPPVVGVRTASQVRLRPMASTRVWRADERLPTAPRWQWRTMRWRRGRTGWRLQ